MNLYNMRPRRDKRKLRMQNPSLLLTVCTVVPLGMNAKEANLVEMGIMFVGNVGI